MLSNQEIIDHEAVVSCRVHHLSIDSALARRRPADDGRRLARRQGRFRSPALARRLARRLRGLRARPGHRQEQQQSLARAGRRGRAQTIDDRAGRQQPPALEPRRQDDRVRLAPGRLGPGLALADRRRRAAPAHQAADRRLGPDLVAQGRQDRLHRRGLPRADSRADRRQRQGKRSLQEEGSHLTTA